MKKKIVIGAVCGLAVFAVAGIIAIKGESSVTAQPAVQTAPAAAATSAPSSPEFYRGIYLTQPSGKNLETLKRLTENAKRSKFNVMVIDVQPAPSGKTSIPKENIDYLVKNGIYPIARVVCFDGGLKQFPIEESVLANRIAIAKSACEIGFKEVQFDYIRFNDDGYLRKISTKEKADFIEKFLARAKAEL
ncbi:MAG: putative glycoside hydrolase, partial [Spirochaetota bacterium]